MRKLLTIVLVICSLGLSWAAVSAQDGDAPAITAFIANAGEVSRSALESRTARISVSWETINRPEGSTLVFDQMMPDGTVVNVELPRANPWVASSGDGIAAPILPSDNTASITLRVILIDATTRQLYDERTVELPVVAGEPSPGDNASRPAITSFTSCCPAVRADELADNTARVPVAWRTVNRPLSATLVFDQVLEDGSVVNVELPRENPWVASSGTGVVAPVPPKAEDGDTILVRVRLLDALTGQVYDQRVMNVVITAAPTEDPTISYFHTSRTSVFSRAMAGRQERVPVFWAVDNRPNGSNLIFEQVLPDGAVVNVELPRQNPWVASQGEGVVNPVLPGGADSIELRVRLINTAAGGTIASKSFSLPITDDAGQSVVITSYSASTYSARNGDTITLAWAAENAATATIREVKQDNTFGQWYEDLPASGTLEVSVPDAPATKITYQLLAVHADGTTIPRQLDVQLSAE